MVLDPLPEKPEPLPPPVEVPEKIETAADALIALGAVVLFEPSMAVEAAKVRDLLGQPVKKTAPTKLEIKKYLQGVIAVLSADPSHDLSIHEGDTLSGDPDMTACPQCHAITVLQRMKDGL